MLLPIMQALAGCRRVNGLVPGRSLYGREQYRPMAKKRKELRISYKSKILKKAFEITLTGENVF